MINLFIAIELLLIGISATVYLVILGCSKKRIDLLLYVWLTGFVCAISAFILDIIWIISLLS